MTRKYTDLEDLMSDLDSDSLLDDPLLGSFDDEEMAMLGSGSTRNRSDDTPAKPAAKKRGRPKKVKD